MATRRRPGSPVVAHSAVAGTATVDTAYSVNREPRGSQHREETLLERTFSPEQAPASVRVGVGMTIATAPFESLRIDVAVTLPCLSSEVEDAYVQASEYAATFLQDEQARWQDGGS